MASRKSLWTVADAVQWMTGSSERRIAALHALASVAAVPADGGSSHLSANAEECFREAAFSATTSPATALLGFARQPFPEMRIASFRYRTGLSVIRQESFIKAVYGIARLLSCCASPATMQHEHNQIMSVYMSIEQDLHADEMGKAYRFIEALAGRTWGAAEVCREAQLVEQLGRLDLAPEVQPFAHAALVVSSHAHYMSSIACLLYVPNKLTGAACVSHWHASASAVSAVLLTIPIVACRFWQPLPAMKLEASGAQYSRCKLKHPGSRSCLLEPGRGGHEQSTGWTLQRCPENKCPKHPPAMMWHLIALLDLIGKRVTRSLKQAAMR